MTNQSDIHGNQNVVLQGVTDSTITLYVNGETQEIRNELTALRELLQRYHTQNIQFAQSNYHISQLNEANFGFVTGKKAFNELLTKRLIEALTPYSNSATKFLQNANNRASNWESQTKISNQAKDVIAYSFVGVLGIQLRKLMAIGKEDLSETKQRKYIENCVITTERALQLLCFALISKLWDYKKEKAFALSQSQTDALAQFFNNIIEFDIQGYLNLLKNLYHLFTEQKLDFPMSELTDFSAKLEANSELTEACKKLCQIDLNKFTLLDCFEAENQLTTVLVHLAFFANYKMVSIKSIAYDEMRNSPPRYLHSYAALGIDSKFNVNSERVNYVGETVCTDAILLYKGRYQESINLFPFVIDVNALTFEGGAKICFYSAKAMEGKSLNYRFLEDNSEVNIDFKGTLKADTDINELMIDKEKRKQLKLDVVFLQFQEAKRTLLPMDDEQGFAALFEGEQDF